MSMRSIVQDTINFRSLLPGLILSVIALVFTYADEPYWKLAEVFIVLAFVACAAGLRMKPRGDKIFLLVMIGVWGMIILILAANYISEFIIALKF